MKNNKSRSIIVMILLLFIGVNLKAQCIVDFGKFPVSLNTEEPLQTAKLLTDLGWEKIKEYVKHNEEHNVYEKKDSLRTEYEYVEQGRRAAFKIISFDGKVLEFYSEIRNTTKPSQISYFDKQVFMSYVEYRMPNIDEEFKVSLEQPTRVLKSYYTLIGLDSSDEYGWICEYGTAGMPPVRRRAVIGLLGETEILINLLDFPNIQTQLYAADALIYDDYQTKELIKKGKAFNLESRLISKETWEKIYEIRDRNEVVKICGNRGSYKIYEANTKELLSDKAIEEIKRNYKMMAGVWGAY